MESVANTPPLPALQVRPKSPDPERDSKIQPIVPSDETQKTRKYDTSSEDQDSQGKIEIDVEKLREAVEPLFTNDTTRLAIDYNEEAGRFVYRGIDKETGEVVKEYPPEEVIEQIARLRAIAGLVLDAQT